MKSDTYHHGHLKEELIEKGLEYIDRHGSENLSLRKLADSVGVSPAAPYAHFKSKEAFLTAVRDYITDRFYTTLKEAADNCSEPSQILLDLGKSYVLFFYKNPLYYQFLFAREDIDTETYPPFQLFQGIAENVIEELANGKAKGESMPSKGDYLPAKGETVRAKVIALWALVHGLASVVTIKGAVDKDHLEEEIERILGAVSV